MKTLLSAAILLAGLTFLPVHAQTAAPAGPMAVLSPAEKARINDAHMKALKSDTALMTEETKIRSDVQALQASNGTSMPRDQFAAEFMTYRQHLETDMVKIDPTVQPIIDKLHAAETKMRAAAQAQAQAPTQAPPPQ